MSEDRINSVASGLAVFLVVLVGGFLAGALALMLISFGAWPWLMWSLFGVYMLRLLVSVVSNRKKAAEVAATL